MQDTSGVAYESKAQALDAGPTEAASLVKMWLAAIDAASREEKQWRLDAEKSVRIYRAEDSDDSQTYFNILHSNTETILPAIYNSTPVPDIRRRFNDPGGPAKAAADILERGISYALDSYDFDGTMRSVLFDAYVVGRGLSRVRYVPYFGEAREEPDPAPELEAQEPPEAGEPQQALVYEEVCCEYVPWGRFRRGPGTVWEDVRWIAFEHFLSRAQLEDLSPDGKTLPLDATIDAGADAQGTDAYRQEQRPPKSEIFGRARVWEVWDKDSKQVHFIAPGQTSRPLKTAEDPLGLQGFFPIPRPVVPLPTPGNLVPMCPYRAYRRLAEELNDVTRRIARLIKQLRVRGLYAAPTQSLEGIMQADDGEIVPAPGLEMFITGAGLDKAIAWWPIEPAVKALAQLYQQREQVKQTIYEVTGLADIMRGATMASETATAQQIKTQWGSLRIQRMQADVQRYARDLFRLKAEVLAEKFQMQTLMMMTGVQLVPMQVKLEARQMIAQVQQMAQQAEAQGAPPPPPVPPPIQAALDTETLEEVESLLRSDVLRSYRIDIESDSTIRADLTRDKQEVAEFVQGTAAYVAAIGPAVQAGVVPKDLALEIFGSFARLFRLGKSAEDAMERAGQQAKEEATNPPPQPPPPEAMKAQAEMQALQARTQLEGQAAQQKLQLEQQKHQADMEQGQQAMMLEAQKAQHQAELDRAKLLQEHELKRQDMLFQQMLTADAHNQEQARRQADHQAALAMGQVDGVMAAQRHGQDMAAAGQQVRMAQEKHIAALAASAAKARQQPQKR